MNSSTNTEMLNAFELFHYAWKFRNSRFLLVLEPSCSLESVLPDIQLLQRAHIPFLILQTASSLPTEDRTRFVERGLPLAAFSYDADTAPASLNPDVSECLDVSKIPIILFNDDTNETSQCLERLLRAAEGLASELAIKKTFFLNTIGPLRLDDLPISHISFDELQTRLEAGAKCNFPSQATSSALATSGRYDQEFVFLEATRGALFTELFTHRGSGTLLTDSYSNTVRSAKITDVYDMMLLMNPAMNEGSVLFYSEEQIATEIDSFSVYSVNGSIVATAKLNDFGDAAELGKFCTLPRYRGRGRARELALHLIEKAKTQGKDYVFGLSTSAEMWRFFLALGFKESNRDLLPQAWKEQYDFSRSSKAFTYQLLKKGSGESNP